MAKYISFINHNIAAMNTRIDFTITIFLYMFITCLILSVITNPYIFSF